MGILISSILHARLVWLHASGAKFISTALMSACKQAHSACLQADISACLQFPYLHTST